MADLEKLVEEISALSLLEASELVKMLEEKLGVSAAAPVAMAAMPMAAAAAEPEEEKTEFDVVLKEIGEKKIEVIKVVRKLTNLGLKEAKELVESAPTTVLEAVPKDMAENARSEIEGAGATVEIK
ncbi:MAG TPA: 50S ribosomal protein L7/L12 [Anaerolineales bacterium]|nr:50S ribosomal protein L7/L12 [Anaerolineales bacterium]